MIGSFIYLGIASIFDIRKKKIPLILPIFSAFSIFIYSQLEKESILPYVIAMIPGMCFILLSVLTKESIGIGDGVSLCIIGGFEGVRICILTACLAILLLFFTSVSLLIMKKATKKTRIPWLPFLLVARAVLLFAQI